MLTANELNINSFAIDLGSYLEPEQIDQVVKAYHFAESAHKGQKRKSGEPYITHPLAVANILSDMHMDHQCLMAALLHDVIEDSNYTIEDIKKTFGNTISKIVYGLTKISNLKKDSYDSIQAENFRKMLLTLNDDVRVIIIKRTKEDTPPS